MRLISMIAGWTVVLLVTTAVTWQIVGAADAQVSQRPASPLNVSAPEFNTSTTTNETPATNATEQSSTAPPPTLATTSSTTEPATSSTTASPGTTAPSTTVPDPTTTTTANSWTLTSKSTVGGVVVIAHRPGEVTLQAATPAPGFQAEIKNSGHDRVEVEFESETMKVEISAEWDDGELEIDVSVEDED